MTIQMSRFANRNDRNALDLLYTLYMRPHLDYGDIIYHNQRTDLMKLIEEVHHQKLQNILLLCEERTHRLLRLINLCLQLHLHIQLNYLRHQMIFRCIQSNQK